MTRSSKKGPFVHPVLMKRVALLDAENKKQPVKTFSRACVIAPEFIGHTFQVYNGQKFIPVFCTESMVGHRLGEFAPTRLFRGHGGKLAKAQS